MEIYGSGGAKLAGIKRVIVSLIFSSPKGRMRLHPVEKRGCDTAVTVGRHILLHIPHRHNDECAHRTNALKKRPLPATYFLVSQSRLSAEVSQGENGKTSPQRLSRITISTRYSLFPAKF